MTNKIQKNNEIIFYCFITILKIYIKYLIVEEDLHFVKGNIKYLVESLSRMEIKIKKNLLLCIDLLKYCQNVKYNNTETIGFMINSLNIICKN